MAREGSTFKRCSCRHPQTGKPLGTACPKLKRPDGRWNPGHGSWGYQIELPPTTTGRRRQARRTGLGSQDAARQELDHIKDLLGLAHGEEHTAARIADLIKEALNRHRPLPGTEEVRARTSAGAAHRDRIPTVAEWLDEWLAGKRKLADSTRLSYQGHITNHLVPHIGWVRLDKLAVGHLQAMFDAIEETNAHIRACRDSSDPRLRASVRGRRVVSLSTQHRIRATLRSALSTALARPDLPVQFNVASHLELDAAPRPKPVVWTPERLKRYRATGTVPARVMVWTPEQTAAFLERALRHRLYALFHLVAFKGLRRGEAVALGYDDLDLSAGTADISRQTVQLGWKTITTQPKTAAGIRTITLDTETVKVLKAWRNRHHRERLAAGDCWSDTGLVFTHPDGAALQPSWVSDQFTRLAAEADLPPITLHGLRHGAASLSLAAGVDVKVVSAELGHSTTYFTQDTYQTVFPEVARAAAEATAALVPLRRAPSAPRSRG
ncbi:tyrosine-type recombinase/integrase [Streptomonospora nanhaiensis]|uniref:tyrosine-type recombinase/integrase n=1 Tax=Streptomonospora nanhaiensis TaxID=1323731 RepID=UPI001C38EA3C|nr:site-specific integrase [Streptomonospora nanhaiensis]MBV2366006.1 site-specific integrase [Streptomonospora nanhaiensis]MBX9388813.1 site-specific integrase [Streptomonospora nanhaiensis]